MGRYARITNELGNDVTHRIVDAQNSGDELILTLELDPRIGEGPVGQFHNDGITSAVRLLFGEYYYAGKTLTNENRSAIYRINGVRQSRIYINSEVRSRPGRRLLRREFRDFDGDHIAHFFIYDYGPGDTITVHTVVSVEPEYR